MRPRISGESPLTILPFPILSLLMGGGVSNSIPGKIRVRFYLFFVKIPAH